MPTRFLINLCQIITFLILKSDNIENSRIELKGIVLPVPSNQIKVTFIIFTLQLGTFVIFFLFHIEIEGKCGWILLGGQRVCWPPSQIMGPPPSPCPPPPPPNFLGLWFVRLCGEIIHEIYRVYRPYRGTNLTQYRPRRSRDISCQRFGNQGNMFICQLNFFFLFFCHHVHILVLCV